MKKNEYLDPAVRTVDELSVMTDQALEDLERYCVTYIDRWRSQGVKTRAWEEELCYIQRERDIRKIRSIVHQQWMEELNVLESPDEDWIDDNSQMNRYSN